MMATIAAAPARPQTPKFTGEQERALAQRSVSVALSAGAGCGKTFVLTQRFLALFDPRSPGALSPENIGGVVAITFTNAAAREMRDRVRRACYQRLRTADAGEAAYWSALARSLDSARISTIDSFCGTLLRSHAVEAALDPQFTVLEPAQADSLLVELSDDLLRERLAAQDPATLDLAVLFDLAALADRLRRLAGHRDADRFKLWAAASPAALVERWAALHRDRVVPYVMRRVAESEAALRLVALLERSVPLDPVVQEQRAAIRAILAAWRRGECLGSAPSSDLDQLRANAMIKKRGPKTWPDAADYEAFRDLSKELRERVIDRVSGQLAFEPQAALAAALVGLQLLALAGDIHERYEQAKQTAGALDIRDLLVRGRALLTDPARGAVAERVSGQIHLLLVDEFQDTDPLQVELIAALCAGGLETGKLFFVGDYKQSIYRFRGADPLVFRSLRQRMPAAGRLPLTLNFRSQPAILNFVNAVFAGELGPEFEPLRASRPQATPTPAIEFLWAMPAPLASAVKESQAELRRREADWIARRLRAMIDSSELRVGAESNAEGGASARPVRFGDIAILFRALSDVGLYEEALRRHGLPYYLVGGHAFYAQQEIFDLANLLRAVQDRADVVSLAGALRSPFFSLSDETLFWLAQQSGGLGAGLLAKKPPRELSAQQRRGVAFAAQTIQALRAAKDRLSIAELIQMALQATGYDAVLLAEFLGERKLANLRKLVDMARDFEREGMFQLSDFIAELAGQVAEQPKEALAATHGADGDVVRLMSIHQSKGLEFPVVVVADCDRVAQPRPAGVEFHADWGPLVKLPDDATDSAPVGGYELFHLLAAEEDEAEIRRLFYVATTRAADMLIVSAGLGGLDKLQGPWLKLLEKRFDLATGELRDSKDDDPASANVTPTRPVVAVITRQPECGAAEAPGRTVDWGQILEEAGRQAAATPESALRLVDPIRVAEHERRLFSFSRLSGAMHARRRPVIAPDVEMAPDEQAAALDPLGLGTLVHAVIAELRFPCSPAALEALLRRHAERHLDPAGPEVGVARGLVERFLKSPRAAELAAAKTDLVETEFLLAWPGNEAKRGGIQLTGFIDRLYQSASGEWTLLDFKTNRVAAGELESVAREYELQMLVYAAAAERVLGQPPRTLALHMLRGGEERLFAWDESAAARLSKLLGAALAPWRNA